MRPSNLIAPVKPVSPEFDIFDCAYISSGASAGKTADLFGAFNAKSLDLTSPMVNVTVGAPTTILLNDTISPSGDFDIFTISLVAGETYMFSVYGSGVTPLQDSILALFDPDGNFIDLDDDGGSGTNSLFTYTASVSGTYFIDVEAYPGSGLTGQYTLDVVTQPATDVVSSAFPPTATITPGVTYGFVDNATTDVYGFAGDVDSYKIHVEAGKFYQIEVAGGADYASDYLALPPGELDTFIILYDQDGNLVTFNDDIAFPGDISSKLGFFADYTGDYYLDVTSYKPWTGGFTITTQEIDLSTLSPLDAIDWESSDTIDVGAGGVVKVYFALPGENFGELADNGVDPAPSFGWNAFEKQQMLLALNSEYGKILGFTYEETTNEAEAEFRIFTTDSDQFGAFFYPQDPVFGSSQGVGAFNVNSGGWDKPGVSDQDIPGNQVSLLQGGFSFAVMLHEFGHAHGLAHPHDTGGGSDIMPGVTGATGSYGVFDLNQGVYTVMSYNDAWDTGPNGPTPFTISHIDSGWSGTLGAFDIAQLQEKYGINNPYATGNTVYTLKDIDDVGTYYETIWDTGGTDEIRYSGNRNARIDLLAATIDYSPTGGGVVSYVDDVFGGYTIARGVVIENATGGNGDDGILGNAAANVLTGNGGDDILVGREGGDTLDGGSGNDTASYIDAKAGVVASLASGNGTAGDAAGDEFDGIENLTGSQFGDTLIGDSGDNVLAGLDGSDTLNGNNQQDTLEGGGGDDSLNGGNHDDLLSGGDGNDVLIGGNHNDVLNGGAGNDNLNGGNHNDVLNGGAGDDQLSGGNQSDVFLFTETGYTDRVLDFRKGQDLIDLSDLDANSGAAGHQSFTWIGAGAFTGVAGQLRSFSSGGNNFVTGDTNGDAVADFTIQTNVLIAQADIIFA